MEQQQDTLYQFEPPQKIRELDVKKLEGLEIEIELLHSNADPEKDKKPDNQYVSVVANDVLKEYQLHLSGWVGKFIGDKGTKIKDTITEAWLMVHNNGGRDPYKKAKTYAEFFDEKQKARIMAQRSAGMIGRMMNVGGMRGDIDRADIIVKTKRGFEIDSMCWGIEAPQEWKSEQYSNHPALEFLQGFFDSATEAIDWVKNRKHDDMFGERYFPVAAWTKDKAFQRTIDKARNIPKAASDPIDTGKYFVVGGRCKPYEFEDFVNHAYESGGAIARGVEWNWE